MRDNDFRLEIISRHPKFSGQSMKKYFVDEIDTVGVFGDEPFEINFHNASYEDVSVRISLDGVDTLTGKPADLNTDHQMWLVRARKTLHLKAWHESQNGGARFVFTGADKSVALHTTGDISHKGIISAAVFTEQEKKIYPRFEEQPRGLIGENHFNMPRVGGQQVNSTRNDVRSRRALDGNYTKGVGTSNDIGESSATMDCFNDTVSIPCAAGMDFDLKKEASVGAGEYVEQRTKTVQGLTKPGLHSIIRVRYLWWDDLVAALKVPAKIIEDRHPTGFPAEKEKTFVDLTGVPRVKSDELSRFV